MGDDVKITVPDIGDFTDVAIIDVLVKPGDQINAEDSLITLESDKATMDVPSPVSGTVGSVAVKVGDKVSEGALILTLARSAEPAAAPAPPAAPQAPRAAPMPAPAPSSRPATKSAEGASLHAEVLVLGAGPGGYTAAFRAADLGRKTVLVERYPDLGGVCLNVGCIPSKALLHTAAVIAETRAMAEHGVSFGRPKLDLDKLRDWKQKVVSRLTKGLVGLAKQRKIEVVHGRARFSGKNTMLVSTSKGDQTISFDMAIIAAGSRPVQLPGFPKDHPRVIDSTGALALPDIPGKLLVIGGGIIGLEMAAVYHELGSKVTVVELTPSLLPGVDADLVKPLARRIERAYDHVYLGTKVTAIEAGADEVRVAFSGAKAPDKDTFDRVLVAVGRIPNGHDIGADQAGVNVDDKGFIKVDSQQRTNVENIFAIGDIVGQPMLAHKATHEGKVAAEVCAGMKSHFDARVIPGVAYTDPEVAWVGVTEEDAKRRNISYGKGTFPWAASGRSLSLGRDEGMTKLLFDKADGRIIGGGVVGTNAGELIAEIALAIEMGCDAADIGLTIHAHPTLSETVAFSAESFEGTITDLYVPRKK